MLPGRGRPSPRRSIVSWRPGSARRPKPRTVGSMALNRATRTLNTVASVDTSTQRGNIKVVVRVRPANGRENNANSRIVVHAVDQHMVLFDPPADDSQEFYYRGVKQNCPQKIRHKNTKLAFDNVYGPQSTNSEIFDDVIKPMLDTLLNGFNCSVFAYGATGAGKTHTMLGSETNPGLTFQTVMELYNRLEEMSKDYETEVAISYLEVYNETVKDLLQGSGSADLTIREDANGLQVTNLTTHKPKDAAALLKLLAYGNSVRSQHPTDHNAESSRSHAVFQVHVNLRSHFTELTNKYRSAKLVMVDLAGSERGAATGFHGQRFREGASINKSLLALGNCINALADGKKHIPYRDSKLTRILKDALGGNCKTVMIANVSPSVLSYDDSYNTLRYADRAKRIKCQVKKNTMSVTACLSQYTKVVEEMSHKIEKLQSELAEERERNNQFKELLSVTAATTETEGPLANKEDHGAWCTNSSGVPEVATKITELMQKKEEAQRILCNATTIAATMAIKIAMKKRRISSIKKFKSFGAAHAKSMQRLEKQLDPLETRFKEATSKKSKALDCIRRVDDSCENLPTDVEDSDYIPMKMSDYMEFQKLKAEASKLESLKTFYKDSCEYLWDEVQKNERILGKAVEFSSSQYLMNKHYAHTTQQMDEDYDGLVADMCGTRVHWSGDMDSDDVHTSMPSMKTIFHDDYLLGKEAIEADPSDIEHSERKNSAWGRFKRPATPPRNVKTRLNDELESDWIDDNETSELETFRSETSVLNAIAASTDLVVSSMQELSDRISAGPSFSQEMNMTSTTSCALGGSVDMDVNDFTIASTTARSDQSEYCSPVPLFLNEKDGTMKYDLTEMEQELEDVPMDLSKENTQPLLTYRVEAPSAYFHPIDTTFDVTFTNANNFNANTTFDLDAAEPDKQQFCLPSTSVGSTASFRTPLASQSSIPTVITHRSAGFESRSCSKDKTINKNVAQAPSPCPLSQSSANKAGKPGLSSTSIKKVVAKNPPNPNPPTRWRC